MILELADVRIQPGQQAAFDAAIVRGVTTVIAQAKGYRGYKVNKGVESPERLRLSISASSSRVNAACRSASSAAKVLFIGP